MTLLSSRWTEQKSATISDYIMGTYVLNSPKGIRQYPYSTSKYASYDICISTRPHDINDRTTNPLRYSSIKALNEVHSMYSLLFTSKLKLKIFRSRYRRSLGKYAAQCICCSCGKIRILHHSQDDPRGQGRKRCLPSSTYGRSFSSAL